jgi:hypothetical protein
VNGNVMLFVSSFGWVTALAVPVIVVAWWMSGRSPPRKHPFPVPFSGIDVILLTFALIFADAISYAIVSQPTVVKWLVPAHLASEATAGLDLLGGLMIAKAKQSEVTRTAAIGLFARLISATLAVLIVIGRRLAMERSPLRIAGQSTIWYAGVAWLVIAPIVLTISAVVSQLMIRRTDRPRSRFALGRRRSSPVSDAVFAGRVVCGDGGEKSHDRRGVLSHRYRRLDGDLPHHSSRPA